MAQTLRGKAALCRPKEIEWLHNIPSLAGSHGREQALAAAGEVLVRPVGLRSRPFSQSSYTIPSHQGPTNTLAEVISARFFQPYIEMLINYRVIHVVQLIISSMFRQSWKKRAEELDGLPRGSPFCYGKFIPVSH